MQQVIRLVNLAEVFLVDLGLFDEALCLVALHVLAQLLQDEFRVNWLKPGVMPTKTFTSNARAGGDDSYRKSSVNSESFFYRISSST